MAYNYFVLKGQEIAKEASQNGEEISSTIRRTSMPKKARGTAYKGTEYVSGLTKDEKRFLKAIGTELDIIIGENAEEIQSEDYSARIQNSLDNLNKQGEEVSRAKDNIPSTINLSEDKLASKNRFAADITKDENGEYSYSLKTPYSKTFDGIAISLTDLVPGESYYEKRYDELITENPDIDKEVEDKGKAVARAKTVGKIFPSQKNTDAYDNLNSDLKNLNIKQAQIAKAANELNRFRAVMESKDQVEAYLKAVESYEAKLDEVVGLSKEMSSPSRSVDSKELENAILNALQKKSISLDDVESYTNGVLTGRIGLTQENNLSENESESVALSDVSLTYLGLKKYIDDKITERNVQKGYKPEEGIGDIEQGELREKLGLISKLEQKNAELNLEMDKITGKDDQEQGEQK